jgi:hypothetical protein
MFSAVVEAFLLVTSYEFRKTDDSPMYLVRADPLNAERHVASGRVDTSKQVNAAHRTRHVGIYLGSKQPEQSSSRTDDSPMYLVRADPLNAERHVA